MSTRIVRFAIAVALLSSASFSAAQSARCPAAGGASESRLATIPDRDGDGVLDDEDLCVDEPAGLESDPRFIGCPALDRDGDGTPDHRDACPLVHDEGNRDRVRPGCPASTPRPVRAGSAAPTSPGHAEHRSRRAQVPGAVADRSSRCHRSHASPR